jgi:plasmid stabilization system protein ParE
MDFKVIFTKTFCDDLERIIKYIAENNPDAGSKLGGLVVDTCERLSFFPRASPRSSPTTPNSTADEIILSDVAHCVVMKAEHEQLTSYSKMNRDVDGW